MGGKKAKKKKVRRSEEGRQERKAEGKGTYNKGKKKGRTART